MPETQTYDVIVVGSGSAGSVVARRLVDAGASVLLLEAGNVDENPSIHTPARVFELWDSPEDWGYRTQPQVACHNRALHLPRGKVLGGSSALNGMIYVRGDRADFDAWAYLGNAGWGYDDVLPLFKRSEDFDGGASEYHGEGGPMRITTQYEPHPLIAAIVAAAQEAGIPFNEDYNAEKIEGVDYAQLMIKEGKRQTTAGAFLGPVLDAPNLTIRTRALARRLLFDGTRCVGVEFAHEGGVATAYAEHEVVVSAGVIESPKLLMLSGIGDAAELGRVGVDVVADLPGVGKNLHDHVLSPTVHSTARTVPQYLDGLQQFHGQLWWYSRPGLVVPDIQPLFFHLPLYPDGYEGPPDGFTMMGAVVRPASRGTLKLASTDPEDAPLIDVGYLREQADVDALVTSLELVREIAAQPALAEWRGVEVAPGPEVRTREQLEDYARSTAITYHHQVGTCKMGIDAEAVVDPELRVYGVEGLRVADASIMPAVTSGNTHAPTVMIGERAGDLVREALGVRAAELSVG